MQELQDILPGSEEIVEQYVEGWCFVTEEKNQIVPIEIRLFKASMSVAK